MKQTKYELSFVKQTKIRFKTKSTVLKNTKRIWRSYTKIQSSFDLGNTLAKFQLQIAMFTKSVKKISPRKTPPWQYIDFVKKLPGPQKQKRKQFGKKPKPIDVIFIVSVKQNRDKTIHYLFTMIIFYIGQTFIIVLTMIDFEIIWNFIFQFLMNEHEIFNIDGE